MLDGSLAILSSAGNNRDHIVTLARQSAANCARGAAEATDFAPGGDLIADETDPHAAPR
jgi:hypothetical protein